MKRGGFALTKWLSNSQAVMEKIPESDQIQTKKVTLAELPTSRALGVTYNGQSDCLHLSATKEQPTRTPQEVLSRIESIWDPHGWPSPFIIRGRLIQQTLCLEKMEWDVEF